MCNKNAISQNINNTKYQFQTIVDFFTVSVAIVVTTCSSQGIQFVRGVALAW
jgi:hypothetical protein